MAWFITKFISLAQVSPAQYSLTIQIVFTMQLFLLERNTCYINHNLFCKKSIMAATFIRSPGTHYRCINKKTFTIYLDWYVSFYFLHWRQCINLCRREAWSLSDHVSFILCTMTWSINIQLTPEEAQIVSAGFSKIKWLQCSINPPIKYAGALWLLKDKTLCNSNTETPSPCVHLVVGGNLNLICHFHR